MAEPALMERRQAPTQTHEDTGLAQRVSTTAELAPTSAAAEAQHEIQAAIVVARRFPRNEDAAYVALLKSCKRTSFAEDASYSFPRGGKPVEGPSVRLAREAARVWGNIRYGLDILRDDDESRDIEGWAWDLQTNTKVTAGDSFRKLIQRKGKNGGVTTWVVPDERDLRELTNRRGAILVRNCILQLMPSDFIEDARREAAATLEKDAAQDPDAARKGIVKAFAELNVTPDMLEAYLEHPIAQCSPAEIKNLREVYASIRDGNSTWGDYSQRERREPEKGSIDLGGVKGKDIPPRDETPPTPAAPEPSGDDAPASARDYNDIDIRAKKKGYDANRLESICMETCGKALGELTHGDANRIITELSKKG